LTGEAEGKLRLSGAVKVVTGEGLKRLDADVFIHVKGLKALNILNCISLYQRIASGREATATREVCKRLGISFITLKRWIYSGRVRGVKTPTGQWMIPESEIERIVSGKVERSG